MKRADIRKIFADATDEQISQLLTAVHDEVDAVRDENDDLKTQLTEAKASAGKDSGEWQKKYESEHSAFEAYKTAQTEKATNDQKAEAYKALLKEAGVSEKRIPSIIKVTSMSDLKIGEDGKLVDAGKISAGIKTDWADFIETKQTSGSDTKTPPGSDGGKGTDLGSLSMAEYIAARKKQ